MRVTVQFRSRVQNISGSQPLFLFMFLVYIIDSHKINRYYVGSADDVAKRLLRHNTGSVTSTRSGLPLELKFTEPFETRNEALKRGRAIKKKKNRIYVKWLISNSKR